MGTQPDIDELFEVKNFYYTGNFQQCINEAAKIRKPSTPEVATLRDIFTYRSYIAQKKFLVVLDEINAASAPEIRPLKMLAEYKHSKSNRAAVLEQIAIEVDTVAGNETLILVAAIIYINEGNLDAAYRYLHSSESLEALAYMVHILLALNRVDLAKKKLKEMQEKDDDATLTQMAQAWIHISMGGDKLQDAYYIYQELVDKFGATPLLLNGQAVTFIGQRKYEEADAVLQEALDRDSNNAEVLINMIALQKHVNKGPEMSYRYLSQLKDAHPEHPFITALKQKQAEFLKICQQYGPTNPVIA